MDTKIIVDKTKYSLHDFYGRVVDQHMLSKTYVSGGGGYIGEHGGVIDPVVVNNYITKEIFLVNEDGHEEAFTLTNIEVPPARAGHVLQIMWIALDKDNYGHYALIRNASLDIDCINENVIFALAENQVFIIGGGWKLIIYLTCLIMFIATHSFHWILIGVTLYIIVSAYNKIMDKKCLNHANTLRTEVMSKKLIL